MSAISKIFLGPRKQESRETLARELLTRDNLYTKTDLARPLAMAVADSVAMLFSPTALRNKLLRDVNPDHKDEAKLEELTDGELLNYILYMDRINAISRGRKSRGEFVSALQQTEFAADKAARRVERLFGLSQE